MSEIVNHYGLGAVRLCTHGLPNLDTRCPYCERDELRAALAQSQERAESLSRELLDAMQARDSYRETAAYAESRAERLEAALGEIDARTGHFGEAPEPPEWMPMLSLIAWVGRTARAALGEEGK